MPLITNQPDNINFLSPLGFKFTLLRFPNVNFYVTDVNLPSLSLGSAQVSTPFKTLEFSGDHLEYGDLQITFMVDEDMQNYLEIYNWITAISYPESFTQYKALKDKPKGDKEGIYSDATLYILNSSMMPNIEVSFQDIFPVSLGDMSFTSKDSDVNYITNTVTFKYKIFKVKKL
jgi:hypothetical protein